MSSKVKPDGSTTATAVKLTDISKLTSKSKGNERCPDKKEEFEFFFGKTSPFSQHYSVQFEIEGVTFNCAEQFMMCQKAVLFKDSEMKEKIMGTSNPVEQKRYGRMVRNFDKDIWAKRAPKVVKEANLAKFLQNKELLKKLLATHPRALVEASPRDRLWGIGLGASNPKARDRNQWRGKNLLGQILTEIRDELLKEEEDGSD